jgi:hypothetical protein
MLRSVSKPPKQRLRKLLLLKRENSFQWQAMTAAKEATQKADMTGMCLPSKLGLFYKFLSFSHLTPPLQCQYFLLNFMLSLASIRIIYHLLLSLSGLWMYGTWKLVNPIYVVQFSFWFCQLVGSFALFTEAGPWPKAGWWFLCSWCEFLNNLPGVTWFLCWRHGSAFQTMCPTDSGGTIVVFHLWQPVWFYRWAFVMGSWWLSQHVRKDFTVAVSSLNCMITHWLFCYVVSTNPLLRCVLVQDRCLFLQCDCSVLKAETCICMALYLPKRLQFWSQWYSFAH